MKTLIIMAKRENNKSFVRIDAEELSRAYSCTAPYEISASNNGSPNVLVLRGICIPPDVNVLIPFRNWSAKYWKDLNLNEWFSFYYGDVEKI